MTPEQRVPVSVCIIAGAEAHRIRRTLESVHGWARELIVVINNDVTDGTDQIAISLGANVFREPWKGYVAQKNSAADKATQPWLLSLDADEEVPPSLRDEIRAVVATPGDCTAFAFPRCAEFCGRWIRHGDWYPDWQTRLWRRGQARWTGATVHERLEVTGVIGRLRSDLLHHPAHTIDHQIAKIASYSRDFALDAQTSKRGANWCDLIIRPVWRFVRAYFFRFGFLDGWQGYYIAWMTAFYTVTRYAKVRAARSEECRKP